MIFVVWVFVSIAFGLSNDCIANHIPNRYELSAPLGVKSFCFITNYIVRLFLELHKFHQNGCSWFLVGIWCGDTIQLTLTVSGIKAGLLLCQSLAHVHCFVWQMKWGVIVWCHCFVNHRTHLCKCQRFTRCSKGKEFKENTSMQTYKSCAQVSNWVLRMCFFLVVSISRSSQGSGTLNNHLPIREALGQYLQMILNYNHAGLWL